MIERRSVLLGLGALFVAPAIVKASSLMKIAPTSVIRLPRNNLMTINQITRQAVEMWVNSNAFIKGIDEQYAHQFGAEGAKIGDMLRIRLPADYVVSDGPLSSDGFPYESETYVWREDVAPLLQIPDSLALAAVAVAAVPVLLEKPVTRRFWSK